MPDAPEQPDQPNAPQQPDPQQQPEAPQAPQAQAASGPPQPPQMPPQMPSYAPQPPQASQASQPQQMPQPPQTPSYAPQAPQGAQQPYPQQPGYAPQQPQQPAYAPPQQYPPQQPGQYAQPYAQQPGYPGAQQGAAVAERKGLSKGALFGIIGGAVAALLAIILVVAFAFNGGGGGGGGGVLKAKTPQGQAAATVENFLTALSKADSKTAYKSLTSTDKSKLTSDAALKKSQELAPITNIVVDTEGITGGTDSDPYIVVPVSFDLGDENVSRTFKLMSTGSSGKGDWRILDGMLSLSTLSFKGLKPSVNGISITDDFVRVFPGAYEIELGVQQFEIDGDTNVFPMVSNDDASAQISARAKLTEEATQTFREMVRASLAECTAMKTLSTPCGMDLTKGFSSGEQAVDGTVTRTLTPEGDAALNNLTARSSPSAPTVVTASGSIRVSIETDVVKDGKTSHFSVLFGAPLLTPTVDFGAETPKVTWR